MIERFRNYLSELQIRLHTLVPPADFHIHTNWTDGRHSVREMYEHACQSGMEGILFSEHTSKTSGKWFYKFAEEVRALPEHPCLAFVGAETRVIDFDGNIGIGTDILRRCDAVVCSVHRFPGKNGEPLAFNEVSPDKALEIEFRLTESLLDNPDIDILGHLFGMCYARFGITPSDEKQLHILQKAAKNNIAVEISSKYHPDPWHLISLCKNAGASVSLGSDAHSKNEVGQIVRVLKRGMSR